MLCSIFIESCIVYESVLIDKLYVVALRLNNLMLQGTFNLSRIEAESIVKIQKCIIESHANIIMITLGNMWIEDTIFDSLYMENIHTHEYLICDDMLKDCNKYPGLTEREQKFECMMKNIVKKRCTIFLNRSKFNGTTEFSKIVTSVFSICDCRVYDYVRIDNKNEEDESPLENQLPGPPEHEFNNQILVLDNTTFYEDADIDNTYRYVRMNNTKFKNRAYLDVDYLHLTEGMLIKRRYTDRKLIDDLPESVSELYKAYDEKEFYEKQQLFTAVKTYERDHENHWWKKLGYYAHELFSGYGKSPARVLSTILITIVAFAAVFLLAGYGTSIDCLIESCSSFFTIGLGLGAMENNGLKTAVILEGAVGFILMTYFVVVLCDRKKF